MAELPPGRRTITRSKSEQRVNLKTLLGRTPSESEKELFARRAIELINQRTLDGNDIEGADFTPYSEAYADKKGVSRNSVDLFLEGDMLGSIRTTGRTANTVSFGIVDSEEAAKSHGHNTGGGRLPKREFFGVTRSEADKIAQEIAKESRAQESQRTTLAQLRELAAGFVAGAAAGSFLGNGDSEE